MIIAKRPVIITVLAITGILWSLLNFVFVFSPFIKKINDWAPAVYGLLVALQFIAFIGIWHMKRWGVLMFIITIFGKLTFSIIHNDVSYASLTLSIIILIFLLIFYKRMIKEL